MGKKLGRQQLLAVSAAVPPDGKEITVMVKEGLHSAGRQLLAGPNQDKHH